MSRARKERTSVFASGLLGLIKGLDRSTRRRDAHGVRDFVFARFAERPVFARPNLWCMIFIDRERHGVIEQTEANGNSAAMHAAIEPRRAGAE
jgi:hypothetical protein